MKDVRSIILALGAVVALAGCQGEEAPASTTGTTPSAASNRPVEAPNADAGVRVNPSADPQMYASLSKGRNFGGSRRDPFSLRPQEMAFDRSQLSEKLISDFGWSMRAEPKPEVQAEEKEEVQPYRRLAGVIIGDTVTAIIIMEDGRAEQIRPGMQIPNSEWTVVSIDEDKAILRRPGTRKPNQIIVNLESAPPGAAGGNRTGGGNNTGGRGGRGGRQGGPSFGSSG